MLENIFVGILAVSLFSVVLLVLGMVYHSFISRFRWYDKIKWTIHLKNEKKFGDKVSPIYKLNQGNWDDKMYIEKWSLKYHDKDITDMFCFLIPYPIKILFWGYTHDDSVYICKKNDVLNIVGTLEENYERIWKEKNKEYCEREKELDKRRKKIDQLNEVFLKNYE